MADLAWIVVERWDDFQHVDVTRSSGPPPWIKTYTRLLDSDDYLELTAKRRALLHGIWLLYARSRGEVRNSPARLGAKLGLWTGADEDKRGRSSVRREDLVALEQAGFIRFSASKPGAEIPQAASGLARARGEEEEETEEEQKQNLRTGLVEDRSKTTTGTSTSTSTDSDNGHKEPVVEEDELLKRLDSTLRDMPF